MNKRPAEAPGSPRRLALAPDAGPDPTAESDDLGGRLVTLADQVARLRHREMKRVLDATVALAIDALPGVEDAGVIVLSRSDSVTATAASGEVAGRLDGAQVALTEGPGIDALRLLDVGSHATAPAKPALSRATQTADLGERGAAGRWPRFTAEARRQGIGSAMALPLCVDPAPSMRRTAAPRPLLVLTLYGHRSGAPAADTVVLAKALAAQAAIALSAAQEVEGIEEALQTRDVIGQAKGILMQRHGLNADDAFARLCSASQHANVKLRDAAAWLVEQTGNPTQP